MSRFPLQRGETNDFVLHAKLWWIQYLVQHGELVRCRVRLGCHVEILYPISVLFLFDSRELVEMCREKAERTWSGWPRTDKITTSKQALSLVFN